MSARFSDGAVRLAGLMPRLLGWPPAALWDATPSEIAAILAPPDGETTPLGRAEFERLMERERNG